MKFCYRNIRVLQADNLFKFLFISIVLIQVVLFSVCVNGNKIANSKNEKLRDEFSGFKLYQVDANSNEKLAALGRMFEEDEFDFWKSPHNTNDTAEVMVARDQEESFLETVQNYAMNYSVVIDDIERLVSEQLAGFRGEEKPMSWTEYHYPETMFKWMSNLVSTRSGLIINSTDIGLTVERRPIKLIKLSTGGPPKPAVFIDGGIHAREWISSAVATYIVNELSTNSTRYENLLKRFDFHIIPLLNPDGYAHSCSYNRLWRKSRKANDMFYSMFGCRGVDLNRNFGYSWGGRGSGRQPCSLIYAGTKEFSEPETAAIRDYIEENSDVNFIAYFSLHSFGQKWLTPWGNTPDLPSDYEEMERVAKIGVAALKEVHGTRYSMGSTNNMLYAASGSSADWFKGAVGTKYSYTLELRDYGLFGFLLPAYQIVPTAEETWAGIQAALMSIPKRKKDD